MKLYQDKVRLLMTDTDSLHYEIKTDDVFKDLYDKDSKFRNMFDNSNFNKTNPYFLNKNNKINGKLKCETSNKIIEEFCCLRSKCYAFRYTSDKGKLVRCKGTTKVVIKINLTLIH